MTGRQFGRRGPGNRRGPARPSGDDALHPDVAPGHPEDEMGDPESVAFFHMAGLDYVSCSPYRVPIARVAAAQAALTE